MLVGARLTQYLSNGTFSAPLAIATKKRDAVFRSDLSPCVKFQQFQRRCVSKTQTANWISPITTGETIRPAADTRQAL